MLKEHQNLGQIFDAFELPLDSAVVHSKVVVMLLLIYY